MPVKRDVQPSAPLEQKCSIDLIPFKKRSLATFRTTDSVQQILKLQIKQGIMIALFTLM